MPNNEPTILRTLRENKQFPTPEIIRSEPLKEESVQLEKLVEFKDIRGKLRTSVWLSPIGTNTSIGASPNKGYVHVDSLLDGLKLSKVHARVFTAGSTGTTDIQITRTRGVTTVDMLSTVLTIDSGETGSDTAATSYVINSANAGVRENDLIAIDVDAVSTTAPKGLLVTLTFDTP